MRYRITVKGTDMELTGWCDGEAKMREFTGALATMPGWPDDPLLAVATEHDPIELAGLTIGELNIRSACPSCGTVATRIAYDIGSGPELACFNCESCWGANGQLLKRSDVDWGEAMTQKFFGPDDKLCLAPVGDLSCMKPPGHDGDHDHRAWPWADKPAVTITEVAYTVTALPIDDPEIHHWTVHVKRVAPDRWAVKWGGRIWNFATDEWEYGPWGVLADDLSADLDTALAQASVLASLVSVNGKTAAQLLAWRAER